VTEFNLTNPEPYKATVLTGNPVVIRLAEMQIDEDGVYELAKYVKQRRPECLPDGFNPEEDNSFEALLPEGRLAVSDNETLAELAGRLCVAEGSMVLTSAGPLPIECVQVGQQVLVNGESFKVDSFDDNGVKPVVRITTTAGYSVECTEDHQVLVDLDGKHEWLEAADLVPGDTLVLNQSKWVDEVVGLELDAGYCCGLFLGDGTFSGIGFSIANLRLFGDKQQLAPIVTKVTGAVPRSQRDGVILSFNSRSWADSMSLLGVKHGTRRVTPKIETSSYSFQLGVLAGLFDTDGSLEVTSHPNGTHSTRRLMLCSSDYASLQAVQRMLLNIGVVSRIKNDRSAGHTSFNRVTGCNVTTTKDAYKLSVTGPSFKIFFETVGSRRAERSALAKAAINSASKWITSKGAAKVEAVTCVGEKRVFDIGVRDIHRFSANGIIVHNCYYSFGQKAGRKENRDYIANTQAGDVAHACYDEATEVLTIDGWKFWSDVTENDLLATRTSDGELQYHAPVEVVSYQYRGRMYRVESPQVDLLVTPNHNMLVCMTSTREGRKRENFQLIQADALDRKSHCYVKTVDSWKGATGARSLLKLLGFAIGDGFQGSAGQQLKFHLRRQRKISYLKQVVEDLGWELVENSDNDSFTVNVPEELRLFFYGMYDERGDKQIPPGILAKYGADSLRALWDGLLNSDGSVVGTTDLYDSTSSRLIDQVQQLLLHIGVCGNRVEGSSVHRIGAITRNVKPEFNRGATLPKTTWEDDWEGVVYCAQVPNNTLYVRRNGIPVWCGNSILYHAKMTFFVAGVSRRLSHELIRHYVGADRMEEGSPSQESTRYVEHSGQYIAHPRVVASAQELEEFQHTCDANYSDYRGYIDREVIRFVDAYDAKPSGMSRKRIFESASSLLLQSCATSFVWTTNPIALAKLVRERQHEAADLEFQRLAKVWKKIAVEAWPNLFPQPWMTLD
jgi:intein/homing endonuclease